MSHPFDLLHHTLKLTFSNYACRGIHYLQRRYLTYIQEWQTLVLIHQAWHHDSAPPEDPSVLGIVRSGDP